EPSANPAGLNDQGYALMRQGRYEEALPLLEQAVAGLNGSGQLAEAYADYNLAFTRLALGRCDGVVELLDRSEQVQGSRKEIRKLRKEAERRCGDGDEG
ncbi:MAG: tetratricopeptide repeat protein, partial [Thermoleophilia bacterium]|nr:tetratricopeptide repeat protein [Thermoleophilia bacterium]